MKELRKSMSILVGTNAYAYVNYKLTGESQQDLVLTLQPKSESSVEFRYTFRFGGNHRSAGECHLS